MTVPKASISLRSIRNRDHSQISPDAFADRLRGVSKGDLRGNLLQDSTLQIKNMGTCGIRVGLCFTFGFSSPDQQIPLKIRCPKL